MDGTTQGRGPVVPVSLSSIRFDRQVWPRKRLDHERVALFASLYQERGSDSLPPIEVVDRDLLLVSDGFTRGSAAEIAGLTELPAIVIDVPEGEDPITFAYLRAVTASTGGAKQLTRAESHAGIRRLIAETDLGDEAIAELFGVTRVTVWRHRHRAAGSSDEHREDRGELHLASATAHEVATRLFRGMAKVYEARGLGVWDALTGDHTGSRLARVLAEVYGERALEQAERFRGWFDDAIGALSTGGPR